MKKIFTIFACLSITLAVTAQENAGNVSKKNTGSKKIASPKTSEVVQPVIANENLLLKETEYDFGKIPQGKPVTHVFEFTNTGKMPLTVDNVQASCGCTTPVWNKEVVAPGKTSKITVGYNAANEGAFAKPVTITYNGNLTRQIIIKGEVWKTPVTSAPENSGVTSLKNEQ